MLLHWFLEGLLAIVCILSLSLIDLTRFRWYRRTWGGHWERWYVEACCSEIWHNLDECFKKKGRPTAFCRGTPVCERWDEPPPGLRYSGPPVRAPGTGYQPIGPVRLACRHGCEILWHPNDDYHYKMIRCKPHNEVHTYFLGYTDPANDSPPPRSR